jgi:hypothetical protein
VRRITPADLGQPASYVEPDLFRSAAPDRFGSGVKQVIPIAFSSSSRPVENDVQFDNGVSVHPIVKTDYKGEKFGQTITYEVRWARGLAACKTAEAAAEVALALSEMAKR